MTLKTLIDTKQAKLIFIDASAKILEAIHCMNDNQVGSLLIRDDKGALVGIVTERDILCFSASRNKELASAEVSEIMTRDPITAPSKCSVEEAMTLMTERRFRHLPIIDDTEIVGMVSIGDLVKARLKDMTVEVKYLRDFISA